MFEELRMARTRISRIVRRTALAGLLVACWGAAAQGAHALSLELEGPQLTATTPSITVEAPTVTTKAPPVTVKPPTVTVKAPPPPTIAPTPKVPPAKPPTVTVKAPSVSTTTPVVGSRSTPSVTVGTPSPTPRTSGGAAGAGATTTARSAPGGSSPVGAGSASSASGSGAKAAGLQPFGSVGAGARPGADHHRAAALGGHAGARERRLKALVARLSGCLGALPGAERQLLELRTGVHGGAALSARVVADRLGIGARRLARREAAAVRHLRARARASDCSRGSAIVARARSSVAVLIGNRVGAGGSGGSGAVGVAGVRYERAAPARSAPPKAASEEKPLLGVGLPAEDIRLLLLIPLVAIGLTILSVLAGARRGPFDHYHGAGLAAWLGQHQQRARLALKSTRGIRRR
jgi:hypothetical protein